MKKVMLVFGTRPEAIKMCPLVQELQCGAEFEVVVCVTGQHREMLHQVLEAFHVKADYDLAVMQDSQTLFDITGEILGSIRMVLEKEQPWIVLVHGDTSTSFTAALACFYMKIPVGHVEAGLRTYDIYSPFPEEFNRQAVGLISRYHFAPTEFAKESLLREGKKRETIYVTGNTVIDALKTTVREDFTHPELEWAEAGKMVLLTAHRRENIGEPMENIFRAVYRAVQDYPDIRVIYPVHKNPSVRRIAEHYFGNVERVHMIEPLDVIEFHNFLSRCYLVLTDSGGIQEEASALGRPTLVMRDMTERPEGLAAGTLRLAGTGEEEIYQNIKYLLENKEEYQKMCYAKNPYGNGDASMKIKNILRSEILKEEGGIGR
ncbi:MAG: UDP-N-acetylglucosamine 2-epimerase (non-hydrolyzing) [Lachnospiraceae bacterium]|nr:UDP-N-acetylglucosamine 2-epimerase (non-hydrolyzing) [Lachnospiraceae bacterium]